ncbi:MAG: hypothetical protein LBJ67_11005 [Planctomycetaceae bacterium]|jgi:hypothetical protein|nr:hypothetical protein [Planctomycetaceae bacterium]
MLIGTCSIANTIPKPSTANANIELNNANIEANHANGEAGNRVVGASNSIVGASNSVVDARNCVVGARNANAEVRNAIIDKNFILNVANCPGNPYDGQTLAKTISNGEKMTGVLIREISADTHDAKSDYKGDAKILIHNTSNAGLRGCEKRRNKIATMKFSLEFFQGRLYRRLDI